MDNKIKLKIESLKLTIEGLEADVAVKRELLNNAAQSVQDELCEMIKESEVKIQSIHQWILQLEIDSQNKPETTEK